MASKYAVISELADLIGLYTRYSSMDSVRALEEGHNFLQLNTNEAWWMRAQGATLLVAGLAGGLTGAAAGLFAKSPASAPTTAPDLRTAANSGVQDWMSSIANFFTENPHRDFWRSTLKSAGATIPMLGNGASTILNAEVTRKAGIKNYCQSVNMERLKDAGRNADQMVQTTNQLATSIIDRSNRKSS